MTGADRRLSSLRADDLAQALGLSQALNWPYRLEDWAFAHALGSGVAARDGARLTGTGMRWDYGADHTTLGMIIVDPAYRGQRLGSALVDALLAEAGGRTVLLNATAEGFELYRRRGFTVVGRTCQHQGLAQPCAAAGLDVVQPAGADDLAAIVTLDLEAAGMPRAHLLDRLVGTGDVTMLRGADGGPRGYAVHRAFGRGHVIGPVVAADADDARTLIGAALARLAGAFVRVDTSAALGLGPWLAAQGLPQVDTVEAMVRGAPPAASNVARIYALCSQSLG